MSAAMFAMWLVYDSHTPVIKAASQRCVTDYCEDGGRMLNPTKELNCHG